MKAKISSFYMVESWIIEEVGFNTNACIIAYIYSYQKNKNKCTPKLDTLSEIMKMSRPAIIRHLKQLESNGYIETVRHINEGKKTSNQINEYRVNLKKFPQYQCKGGKSDCNETSQHCNETLQHCNETSQQSNETLQPHCNETLQHCNETSQPQSNETLQPLNITNNSIIENINTESSLIESENRPTAEPEEPERAKELTHFPSVKLSQDEYDLLERGFDFTKTKRGSFTDYLVYLNEQASKGKYSATPHFEVLKGMLESDTKTKFDEKKARHNMDMEKCFNGSHYYDPTDPMNEGMI